MSNIGSGAARVAACACALLLLARSPAAATGPVIGAQLGAASVEAGVAGQTIRVSAFNDGPALQADVYLAVQAPDGAFYSFTGRDWTPGIVAWLESLSVPAGFSFPSAPVARLPGLTPGTYRVYSAFARPGTLDLLHLHEAPFAVFGAAGEGARLGAVTLYGFQTAIADGGGRRVVSTVGAGGTFLESNEAFEVTREALEGAEPALEQCVFSEIATDWSNLPGGLSVRTLDVGGRVRLSATQSGRAVGALDLPRDADLAALGENIYGLPASVMLPATALSSRYRYTFSAPGGSGLGGFQVAVDGVDPLQLTAPSLTALTSIDSARSLALAWRGGRGIDEVAVSISGGGYPTLCTVNCRFVDDGQASVPAGVLGQLKSCVGDGGLPGLPGIPDLPDIPDFPDLPDGLPVPGFGAVVSFSISRSRVQFFNTTRNELSFGAAVVQAGAQADGVQLN